MNTCCANIRAKRTSNRFLCQPGFASEGIKIGAASAAHHAAQTWVHFLADQRLLAVASWSSIDYHGRWKALQYYARRFYSDIIVSPHEENGNIKVFVVLIGYNGRCAIEPEPARFRRK